VSKLTDALDQASVASGNGACKLCEKLAALPAGEADAIQAALRRGIAVEKLYNILREHGQQVPRRHIERHKKGGHTI
jgi:hypothetical protein